MTNSGVIHFRKSTQTFPIIYPSNFNERNLDYIQSTEAEYTKIIR